MTNPDLIHDEMLDEYDFSNAKRGNPYLSNVPRPIVITTDSGEKHIQIKTVELTAIVGSDGTTTLQLPPDIKPGAYQITVLIQEDMTHHSVP
jgi:hypothetical protein